MFESDDEDGEFMSEIAYVYEVRYLHHQQICCCDCNNMEKGGGGGDIILNLQLQHIVNVTKLTTLDAQTIRVGNFFEDDNEDDYPLLDRVYTISFPQSLLQDMPTLSAYILTQLPTFDNFIDITIDVSRIITYASNHINDKHSCPVILGELNLLKEYTYQEKYVLKKEYVFDYDDQHLNCAVCLEGLAGGIECARTLCSHVFHKSCLFPWMLKHNTCPICRRLIARLGSVYLFD